MKCNKLFIFLTIFIGSFFLSFADGEFGDEVNPSGNTNKVQDIKDLCTQPLNIRDNIILSTVTLCLPGILENLEEYNQIKCEKVVCKYTAAVNGYPGTHCAKDAAYQICTEIYGDIFTLPGFNIAELLSSVQDTIALYLQEPYVGFMSGLRIVSQGCLGMCVGFDIGGFSILLAIEDIASAAQTILNLADNGFQSHSGTDYCAQIDELGIPKEVALILGLDDEEAKAIGVEN
jgi:hypothetical protein